MNVTIASFGFLVKERNRLPFAEPPVGPPEAPRFEPISAAMAQKAGAKLQLVYVVQIEFDREECGHEYRLDVVIFGKRDSWDYELNADGSARQEIVYEATFTLAPVLLERQDFGILYKMFDLSEVAIGGSLQTARLHLDGKPLAQTRLPTYYYF